MWRRGGDLADNRLAYITNSHWEDPDSHLSYLLPRGRDTTQYRYNTRTMIGTVWNSLPCLAHCTARGPTDARLAAHSTHGSRLSQFTQRQLDLIVSRSLQHFTRTARRLRVKCLLSALIVCGPDAALSWQSCGGRPASDDSLDSRLDTRDSASASDSDSDSVLDLDLDSNSDSVLRLGLGLGLVLKRGTLTREQPDGAAARRRGARLGGVRPVWA